MGKYGLRWVASVTNMSAEEVIEQWAVYDNGTENSRKIQSAVSEIKRQVEESKDEIRFIHVDFTSTKSAHGHCFQDSRYGH